MKIETRVVNPEKNIIQITTTDERWYTFGNKFYPSVTWICEYYPKGIAFYKWLANHGWDEAESLKNSAGEKGSRVHHAIEDLIDGKEIPIDAVYLNDDGEQKELTVEEYEAIMSFAEWYEAAKPQILYKEFTVVNNDYEYAGTIDLLCIINDKIYIVDIKTSQYIWPSHELQLSAYKHAQTDLYDISQANLAILQVGYRKNKRRWKLTEINDQFDEFMAARLIWSKETKGVEPKQKDYPLSIKLN